MALEEYGKYKTLSGVTIHLRGILEHEKMLFDYGFELTQILGIEGKSYEETNELLKAEKVFCGLTDDLVFPSGDWHQRTGRCLGGNTGGVMGRGEELRKRLARFDIKIETEDTITQ